MYTVEIEYTTGGTFHTERCTQTIEQTFKTKEEARLVLSYIKDHYKMYKAYRSYISSNRVDNDRVSKKDFYNSFSDKPWFYEKYPEYSVIIPEIKKEVHVFWIGYFETLHIAKVVIVDEKDNEDIFYG